MKGERHPSEMQRDFLSNSPVPASQALFTTVRSKTAHVLSPRWSADEASSKRGVTVLVKKTKEYTISSDVAAILPFPIQLPSLILVFPIHIPVLALSRARHPSYGVQPGPRRARSIGKGEHRLFCDRASHTSSPLSCENPCWTIRAYTSLPIPILAPNYFWTSKRSH